MPDCLTLFANFVPLSGSAQLAIGSILFVIGALLAIWAVIRRNPPLDTTLTKFETTLENLQETVAELTEATKQYSTDAAKIKALQEELDRLRDKHEADMRTQRAHMAKSSREIYDRIEEVGNMVANNFQAVERALGQVEGQLKELGK